MRCNNWLTSPGLRAWPLVHWNWHWQKKPPTYENDNRFAWMLATYHVALGADHALASGDFGGVIGLLGPSTALLVDGEFLAVGCKYIAFALAVFASLIRMGLGGGPASDVVALALLASVVGMGLGGGPASDGVALAVFASVVGMGLGGGAVNGAFDMLDLAVGASVVGLAMASVVGLAAADSACLAAAGLAAAASAGGNLICMMASGGALAPWSNGTPGSCSSSSDLGVTSVVTGVAVASVVGWGVGASVVDLAVGSFVAALALCGIVPLSLWATLQGGVAAWEGSKPDAGITAGTSAVLEPGSKVVAGEAGVFALEDGKAGAGMAALGACNLGSGCKVDGYEAGVGGVVAGEGGKAGTGVKVAGSASLGSSKVVGSEAGVGGVGGLVETFGRHSGLGELGLGGRGGWLSSDASVGLMSWLAA